MVVLVEDQPPNQEKALTESYDGTSWTEVGDLNTARRYLKGCLELIQLLYVREVIGLPPLLNNKLLMNHWNGSAWTEVGDLNSGRNNMAQFGTTSASIVAGGEDTGSTVSS